jgi:uncharacterized protein YndB with AHSA1/START domain
MTDPVEPARQEIVIAAPPARVFDAWTAPDEIPGWYVERQEGDPRRDQRIVWYVTSEDLGGEGEPFAVRTAEPGRRLVLENVGEEPWRGTVLDVELLPEGAGTRVVVEQSGFSEGVRGFAPIIDSGWAHVLAILKEYLEHHAGERRRTAEARRRVEPDPAAVAEAVASAEAIAEWAGEAPERVLATTPRGAVVAFPGIRGVFAFMGVGGAVVWASVWGDGDLEHAKAKAEDLAEQLATRIGAA